MEFKPSVQTVPPWDAVAAVNYGIPLANSDKITLHGQFIYHSHNGRPQMSEVPNSPAYLPYDVADPVTHLTNLRAEYRMNALRSVCSRTMYSTRIRS